jgi:hypothetical protein
MSATKKTLVTLALTLGLALSGTGVQPTRKTNIARRAATVKG